MRPLFIRRVVGHSMEPTLRADQLIVASGWLPVRNGDVVVARVENMEVIKRLAILPDNQRLLAGDNKANHHDIAWNEKTQIIGRVIWPTV